MMNDITRTMKLMIIMLPVSSQQQFHCWGLVQDFWGWKL